MSTDTTFAIVLAAGKGTRMRSEVSKVLHPLAGRSMLAHVMETVAAILPSEAVVVAGPEMDALSAEFSDHPLSPMVTVQQERLGTGHAVLTALETTLRAGSEPGTVLILYGDTPLLRVETLLGLLDARNSKVNHGVAVLGFRSSTPGEYGRLMLEDDGNIKEIVEAKDASPDQLDMNLCNSGVMAVDSELLPRLLNELTNENAKREYYLTDIVAIARSHGRTCAVVEAPERDLMGINTRAELAEAEAIIQNRLRLNAMANGTSMVDPSTVFLSWDTEIGRDVTIEPNVVFGPGVKVSDNVVIKAFSHLEGTLIQAGAVVGPFARLRPGSSIGTDARIGNFVEVKNASISAGAKANHLTYIGDASIGPGANIGAGTITCNYDGYVKSRTEIGAGAFIGSNTSLVAPVKVGDGAITGAGSVITHDVEADALVVERSEQRSLRDWAKKFHKSKGKK